MKNTDSPEKIKILIDESTGRRLFKRLKEPYDTVFVGDVIPSDSPDLRVLEYAEKEGRNLITDDKDLGELIFRLRKTSRVFEINEKS